MLHGLIFHLKAWNFTEEPQAVPREQERLGDWGALQVNLP
jgi:hypothetical protein